MAEQHLLTLRSEPSVAVLATAATTPAVERKHVTQGVEGTNYWSLRKEHLMNVFYHRYIVVDENCR